MGGRKTRWLACCLLGNMIVFVFIEIEKLQGDPVFSHFYTSHLNSGI